MTWLGHGKVSGNKITFSESLPLPEGTEVTVRVETAPAEPYSSSADGDDTDFYSLAFFGMWADNPEMEDSAAGTQLAVPRPN
ncbi:MAG TPA: hypothetical protein VMD30_05575 [Tepidisphaeraceae bacterium]|nr:hypothetical protein [Tepidisphaeraceae bacterium]